jgi:hypothetical protein
VASLALLTLVAITNEHAEKTTNRRNRAMLWALRLRGSSHPALR